MIFTINGCTVDTEAYEIRRRGALVPVEPQVFDLLVLLLENRDRVVTKDEIIERIWSGRIISDAALSSRIKSVRQAIDDDGAAQGCIRTVRRRGFRVVAEVVLGREAPSTTEGDRVQDRRPTADAGLSTVAGMARRRNLAILATGLIALLGVLVAAWVHVGPRRSESVPIAAVALGMPTGPTIAVLGFHDRSGDRTLNFFANAISEEVTTQLTRFSELRVLGRTLISESGRADNDPEVDGQRLGAEFLFNGSLQLADDRVRVTAQLRRTSDRALLWAETYERHITPADIFVVQEDIASKVVATIGSISTGVIARQALGQARAKPPREISAYECTVRANELMLTGFSAAAHLAIRDCLEAAVEREPDYAPAWAILAWVHSIEYSEGHNRRPDSDPRERALAAGRRAVELEPASPLAHFGMARAAYLKRDLDLFYTEAAIALNLNPHDPLLLGNIGNWLAFTGRWDEGVALVRKAIALNPKVYPRWWHAALAKNYYRKREFGEALAEFKRMNLPNWWWNQVELAYTYGQLGDAVNARAAVQQLYELYPSFDLEKAVLEHQKFSFQPSYIELAVDGLRKAGVREKAPAAASH